MCKKVLHLLLKLVRPTSRPQPLFVNGPSVPQHLTSLSSAHHLRGQLMPFRSGQYTQKGGGGGKTCRLVEARHQFIVGCFTANRQVASLDFKSEKSTNQSPLLLFFPADWVSVYRTAEWKPARLLLNEYFTASTQ